MVLGLPDSSVGKESACNAGDLGSILGLGRSPGEEKGYPLQHSGLENFLNCIVHGVSKSWTRLSNWTELNWRKIIKNMSERWRKEAVSPVSCWNFNSSHRIISWPKALDLCLTRSLPGFNPWVGKIPWRRERLPTPAFWPGEFHELYSPWGRKESDMTEWLSLSFYC